MARATERHIVRAKSEISAAAEIFTAVVALIRQLSADGMWRCE